MVFLFTFAFMATLTLSGLKDLYIQSQLEDIANGCIEQSQKTFNLGMFLQEAVFRTQIGDTITFDQDMFWLTHNLNATTS